MKQIFFFILLVSHSAVVWASLATVPYVDIQKYSGKWFEIARIPQFFEWNCSGNTTAEYSAAEDGLIRVINSCDAYLGDRQQVEGRARILNAAQSQLEVTFFRAGSEYLFWLTGLYWVIDLADDYSYAVVGHPSGDYAWVLSREPVLSSWVLGGVEWRLRQKGYDTCRLAMTIQSGGNQSEGRLCDYKSLP